MVKIIAVHSFKGGPGKSTITANICANLALNGKKVGAIDLDISGPGLHVIFKLKKEEINTTLNDVFLMKGVLSETIQDLTNKLGITRGQLYFIPASPKVEEMLKVLAKGYELHLLREALEEFTKLLDLDFIFIDTHPGIEESTLLSMALCDLILIVSRIDNQDLFGTGVLIEVGRAIKKPIQIIGNMLPPGVQVDQMSEKLTNLFKTPILGLVPFNVDVLRALSSKVFTLEEPDHEFSSVINQLSEKLIEG